MKVTDWERQQELDSLRWKMLVEAAAVTADLLAVRSSLRTADPDVESKLDAAVCAYAAKLTEPITCKTCGQVIPSETERTQDLLHAEKAHTHDCA